MRTLSVVGTAAMFLVGGGILTHGIPPVHHAIADVAARSGGLVGSVLSPLLDGLVGVVAGAILVAIVAGARRVVRRRGPEAAGG